MSKTLSVMIGYGDDDEELTHDFPAKLEVCHNCGGEGFVLNPSMRGHAYSREEFQEEFHDEEDREQYFKRGGIYDVVCPTCQGKNVELVIDESAFSKDDETAFAKYQELQSELANLDAMEDAERRMGA